MSGRRFDIRQYKKGLRAQYRKRRTGMAPEEKARRDEAVFRNLISTSHYKKAKTVLVFVSTPIEVDTHSIIQHSLKQGKRVAVPYCVPGTRKMDFYYIHSMDDLQKGSFGLLEPDPETSKKADDFTRSVCVLPGLCFDHSGYRLGYGGGYYDRFLSKVYTGVTVGICYQNCTRKSLVHGQYDVPCHWLVTDAGIWQVKRQSGKKTPHKRESP